MTKTKEEKLKKKLFNCWTKERKRVLTMTGYRVKLGTGTGKRISDITMERDVADNIESVWSTIKEFGIPVDEVKQLKPTYKEIFEIYSAIKAYRISINLLRELKDKIGDKKIG